MTKFSMIVWLLIGMIACWISFSTEYRYLATKPSQNSQFHGKGFDITVNDGNKEPIHLSINDISHNQSQDTVNMEGVAMTTNANAENIIPGLKNVFPLSLPQHSYGGNNHDTGMPNKKDNTNSRAYYVNSLQFNAQNIGAKIGYLEIKPGSIGPFYTGLYHNIEMREVEMELSWLEGKSLFAKSLYWKYPIQNPMLYECTIKKENKVVQNYNASKIDLNKNKILPVEQQKKSDDKSSIQINSKVKDYLLR